MKLRFIGDAGTIQIQPWGGVVDHGERADRDAEFTRMNEIYERRFHEARRRRRV